MGAKRSLVLITVDCFRADHAGFLGYACPTTPFLDSLAHRSLVFSNAIVAGAPTYYSFPAMMSSRYPLSLGRDVIGLAPGEPTIASTLSGAGYATAAFLAANPYLSPRFGHHAGFNIFRDFLDAGVEPLFHESDREDSRGRSSRLNLRLAKISHQMGPVGSLYDELYFQYCQRFAGLPPLSLDQLRRFPSADVIVDQAQDWLSRVADQPFFLWLHLMDPHAPYYPPRQALDLMGQSAVDASRARYLNSYWNRGDLGGSDSGNRRLLRHRDEVVALYDAGIRWMDTQVARLVGMLRDSGRWEDCLLALTADHGEEFLDHGGRYHPPSKVTEELVRVPLLLHGTGVSKPGNISQPFSLFHLAPTLLDLMEIPVPSSFRGSSYLPTLCNGKGANADAVVECVSDCGNPFVVENRLHPRLLAVREGRYKLVVDFKSPAREQLFDLESDPAERHPLPTDSNNNSERMARRRLLERARQHLDESLRSRDSAYRVAARLRDVRLEWAAGTGRPGDRASA